MCKLYMQNKKYTNGLMMSIPSLYKALAANKREDQVMNVFCNSKTSNVIIK